MTNRVQTPRSGIAGNRPTGRLPGELYVNWPDGQLGVINASSAAQDLIAVRFYSTGAAYAIGDFTIQGGQLYRSKVAQTPGSFNAANWDQLMTLAGGTMTGPLILNADPTAALGAATKQYVEAHLGPRNKIINGDMTIDQRNAGASGTATNAYTVDRWMYSATTTGKGVWQQLSGAHVPNFSNFLNFTSTSAYAVATADQFTFSQAIMGQNLTDLGWGAAGAKACMLSFWAYSSKLGTLGGSIQNYAGDRSYPFSYSLPAAGVWTYITIPIPGDIAGTWVMSGLGGGLWINFSLGAGASQSGPAGTWASADYATSTGALSIVATNGENFAITGVQFEVGNVATPFERRLFEAELALCQAYYETSYDLGVAPGAVNNNGVLLVLATGLTGTVSMSGRFAFKVTKRVVPTVSLYSPFNGQINAVFDQSISVNITPTVNSAGAQGFSWFATSATAGSINLTAHYTANAEL